MKCSACLLLCLLSEIGNPPTAAVVGEVKLKRRVLSKTAKQNKSSDEEHDPSLLDFFIRPVEDAPPLVSNDVFGFDHNIATPSPSAFTLDSQSKIPSSIKSERPSTTIVGESTLNSSGSPSYQPTTNRTVVSDLPTTSFTVHPSTMMPSTMFPTTVGPTKTPTSNPSVRPTTSQPSTTSPTTVELAKSISESSTIVPTTIQPSTDTPTTATPKSSRPESPSFYPSQPSIQPSFAPYDNASNQPIAISSSSFTIDRATDFPTSIPLMSTTPSPSNLTTVSPTMAPITSQPSTKSQTAAQPTMTISPSASVHPSTLSPANTKPKISPIPIPTVTPISHNQFTVLPTIERRTSVPFTIPPITSQPTELPSFSPIFAGAASQPHISFPTTTPVVTMTHNASNQPTIILSSSLILDQTTDNPTIASVQSQPMLRGTVWHDENENGVIDEGEDGVAGILIQAKSCADQRLIAFTLSNSNGTYLLSDNVGSAGECLYLQFQSVGDEYTLFTTGQKDGRTENIILGSEEKWNAGIAFTPTQIIYSPTSHPVSIKSSTSAPTTAQPTKLPSYSSSVAPTTSKPSSSSPATAQPTNLPSYSRSVAPATSKPSTSSPTSARPTKLPSFPPSVAPTTSQPSSSSPSTAQPTKSPTAFPIIAPTTRRPSTSSPTSNQPTQSTTILSTIAPTSSRPSKPYPTTAQPTKSQTSSPNFKQVLVTESTTNLNTTLDVEGDNKNSDTVINKATDQPSKIFSSNPTNKPSPPTEPPSRNPVTISPAAFQVSSTNSPSNSSSASPTLIGTSSPIPTIQQPSKSPTSRNPIDVTSIDTVSCNSTLENSVPKSQDKYSQ